SLPPPPPTRSTPFPYTTLLRSQRAHHAVNYFRRNNIMATLRLTLLALVSFALFAPSASAIRVTNLTTGQILFQDNFESVPAYNGPYTSGSGDFDPVAAVGVWDMGPFGGG